MKPLAYDAYEKLADHYAAMLEVKPHNAYYERPAMTAMWPNLEGLRVLDAGCGPGLYAELLSARGARVTAVDVSDRMLQLARERLGATFDLRKVDLSQPLVVFSDQEFDFVNAPLCFDYIADWRGLFKEMFRVLKPGGVLQFSCGHPAFDAEYYKTDNYFSVEQVQCTWRGFGIDVVMPSVRRSLQEALMPAIEADFVIQKVIEPLPTEQFRQADPRRFSSLMHRPAFLCIQVRK